VSVSGARRMATEVARSRSRREKLANAPLVAGGVMDKRRYAGDRPHTFGWARWLVEFLPLAKGSEHAAA
jgi:hypothetical protein